MTTAIIIEIITMGFIGLLLFTMALFFFELYKFIKKWRHDKQ